MNVLTLGPEGLLVVGDSESRKIFALDLEDRTANEKVEGFTFENIAPKRASLLGTDAQR